MSETPQAVIKALPKWVFTVAFCALVVFMVISFFSGTTFKVGGLEFGFSPRNKDPVDEHAFYKVVGTVETSDRKLVNEIVISPRYPPVNPSPEGTIVGLTVWKDPRGDFPILYFSHPAYAPMPLDLNDSDKVALLREGKDLRLHIKKAIIMQKKE